MLLYMKATGDDSLWPDMWLALHLYPEAGCPPTATCHDSDALGFLQYAAVCREIMGFVPPMIVTEWAWTPSQAKPEVRARWVTEVYGWFRDGYAPDYLCAFCYWILFGQIWFGFSLTGNIEHRAVVEAIKAMGEWERGKPTPPPIEEDWRTVGPWGTQHRAVQDLEILKALGFGDFRVEGRL